MMLCVLQNMMLGSIQQVCGQNFAIFWPPSPSLDSFYTLSVDKSDISWPPLLHLVHLIMELPPMCPSEHVVGIEF